MVEGEEKGRRSKGGGGFIRCRVEEGGRRGVGFGVKKRMMMGEGLYEGGYMS